MLSIRGFWLSWKHCKYKQGENLYLHIDDKNMIIYNDKFQADDIKAKVLTTNVTSGSEGEKIIHEITIYGNYELLKKGNEKSVMIPQEIEKQRKDLKLKGKRGSSDVCFVYD